jgi:hypothetical protein
VEGKIRPKRDPMAGESCQRAARKSLAAPAIALAGHPTGWRSQHSANSPRRSARRTDAGQHPQKPAPNPRRPRSGPVSAHARFTRAPSGDRHWVPLPVSIRVRLARHIPATPSDFAPVAPTRKFSAQASGVHVPWHAVIPERNRVALRAS